MTHPKRTIHTAFLCFLGIASLIIVDNAFPKGKPIMRAGDGDIIALFDGPSCEATVHTVFQGKDIDDFRPKKGTATRLMTGVTQLLHRQCAEMTQVTSKGLVKGKIVYNGLASTATKWAIKERGAVSGTGLMAGSGAEEESDVQAKSKFQSNKDFVPYPALLKRMDNRPFLCTNHEMKSNTCVTAIQLVKATADGADAITRSRQDKEGTIATVRADSFNKTGFFCSYPEKARVAVEGGDMNQQDKDTFAGQLTERLVALGKEVCNGFTSLGDEILMESFNEKGQKIGDTATVLFVEKEPGLRQQE